MADKIRILIIEDNPADAELAERELRKSGLLFSSRRVDTEKDFLKELEEFKPDMILSDYVLPRFDALKALRLAHAADPFIPFIVVTGSVNEQTAVNCIKAGATDYVLKDHLLRLGDAVKGAIETKRLALEKGEADREIRMREEYFSSLIENSMDIITILEADGTVRFESPSIERVLGYKPCEMIGKSVFEFIHPDDLPRVAGAFREKIKEPDSSLSLEIRFRHKDGSWRVLDTVSKNLLASPAVRAAVVNSRDVTERRLAEEALADAQQLLRKVLDSSLDMIFVKDRELRTLLCNEAYAAAVGKKPGEMIGHTDIENGWMPELVHGDPAKGMRGFENDDREVLGGKTIHNANDLANVGGEIRVFDSYKIPLYDAQNQVFAVLGVSRDVTERIRAEEKEKELMTRILYLSKYATDAIILLDEDFHFLEVNDCALEFYGYTREELTGMHATQIRAPETRDLFGEQNRLARDSGSTLYETVHQRKDGTKFPVEIHLRSFEVGGKKRYQAVIRDITERKKAEEALRESEKRFMDVLYASKDAILLIDGNKFVDCNEATARMLGYATRKEFLMTHPSELSPPEQPDGQRSFEKANEMMKRAFEDGFNRFEWIHRKAGGEDFPVEVSLTPISIRGRNILHCLWRDMTEEKKMRQMLQKSEERYRRLFAESRDAMMTLEPPSFRFTSGNPAAMELYGVKDETEFVTLGPWDVSPEKQPDGQLSALKAKAMIGTAIRTGSHFFEWTHKTLRGETFPCTVLLTALKFPEKILIQATVRDITLFKKAENELQRNEERLKILFQISRMLEFSRKTILEFTLESGLRLTDSSVGFIAFMSQDESVMTVECWSKTAMEACEMSEKVFVFQVKDLGLLGEPVRQRKAVIVNDYKAAVPGKHGVPGGHVAMDRYIGLPIFESDRIVAVMAVGNRESDYTQADTDQLHLLTEGVWLLLRRKEAEDELKKNLEDLRQFERAAVNRENVMIDLKKKVNELSRKAGLPEPYDLSFLGE